MKLKQIVMASALTLAAFAPTQSMAAIERGDVSLGAYGMYTATETTDNVIIGVSAGVFVTPHIEVAGDISTNYTYSEQTILGTTTWNETTTQSLNIGADYYFMTDTAWLPFAGGGFSYATTIIDTDTTSDTIDYFALMVEGGVRKPLAESADLDMRVRYTSPTDDLYDDSLTFLVGVKVRF